MLQSCRWNCLEGQGWDLGEEGSTGSTTASFGSLNSKTSHPAVHCACLWEEKMKQGALQIPENGNQPNLCFGGEKEALADKKVSL